MSRAQYHEPHFLPFKKYLVTVFYFFYKSLLSLSNHAVTICDIFSVKNPLHLCMIPGARHSSSLEWWVILREILEYRYT